MLAILFSKDRPFQARECLRTFQKHFEWRPQLSVRVLYAASDADTLSLYDAVASQFPSVEFVREASFAEDFTRLLVPVPPSSPAPSYIMFLVDDIVFTAKVRAEAAAAVLEATPSVVAFHWKLHPAIWFHQPSGDACLTPSKLNVSVMGTGAQVSDCGLMRSSSTCLVVLG